VWDGGQLSYAALNQRANQLAHRLHAFGAGRDQVVAMVMHRGADLLVSMLAVAKAGACFLPLDPDAPVARLADIVADSGAIALLIQQQSLERMAQLHPRTVVVDWQGEVLNDAATANAPPGPASEDLAYVLFTSGSTGKPKGVMLPHAALSLRLAWITQAYGIVPADRSAQGTQTTFDPSLIELFLPLINGASRRGACCRKHWPTLPFAMVPPSVPLCRPPSAAFWIGRATTRT
jgi:non-ribosomal peptide synthetase component F